MRKARQLAVDYLNKMRVFERVPYEVAKARMRKEPIKVRWVDTLNGSPLAGAVYSRMVPYPYVALVSLTVCSTLAISVLSTESKYGGCVSFASSKLALFVIIGFSVSVVRFTRIFFVQCFVALSFSRCCFEQAMDRHSSSASTVPSLDGDFEHNIWNPLLNLLFLEQVSCIFASKLVGIDLPRIALTCHFVLDLLCHKASWTKARASRKCVGGGPGDVLPTHCPPSF